MKKVITHSGSFHADDVFSVATLQLHFGVENVEVIRTRDEEIIAAGDIVLDVGGVYDPEKQRFDHHQNGAPVRDNGLPYAAFGLIWKHYGEAVSGGQEVMEEIERRLVLPIDASDNGISTFDAKREDVSPVLLQDIISMYKPVWGSDEEADQGFLLACELARSILTRSIAHAKAKLEQAQIFKERYEGASDKRVLSFDQYVTASLASDYPEVIFVVTPKEDGNWAAHAVWDGTESFSLKRSFPSAWAGLRDEELASVSGISDAVFCHKAGFLFVARSQEGAIEAAKKALESA